MHLHATRAAERASVGPGSSDRHFTHLGQPELPVQRLPAVKQLPVSASMKRRETDTQSLVLLPEIMQHSRNPLTMYD